MPYDIAIIGAGPAGCTLARLLDRSYRVLLLDKRDLSSEEYPGMSKCCGGLLALMRKDAWTNGNGCASIGSGRPAAFFSSNH